MSPNSVPKSSNLADNKSRRSKSNIDSTVVITVRIDEELNENLEAIKRDLGISKADIIRNYLELSKCLIKQKISIKSLDDQDFIIILRNDLRQLLENITEEEQINLGDKFARFINAIALVKDKMDDLEFKLDLCNNLGFFRKYVDDQNYLLISKKFGPKKFVEAFTWRFFTNKQFNPRYTEDELKGSKNLTQQYNREIHPLDRISSYYSFEFAKIPPD
ncbi:MAG: ribbon-helix-helix domain-containing protein [Candidatus Thorarchaeota archaeon]